MENREQQILAEIKDMMVSIRSQLELLDAKMLELQQTVDPEGFDNDPIELDLEPVEVQVAEVVTEPVEVQLDMPEEEPVQESIDDLPFEDVPALEEEVAEEAPAVQIEESVEEPAEETVEESVVPQVEDVPVAESQEPEVMAEETESDDDDDLPGIFDIPSPSYPAAQVAPKVKPSVAEVMTDRQAWRTDMPGTPVKDVRSAISLNDRIIFINHLFNEDPLLFQNVIVNVNSMETLDQVVDYVTSEFPAWDMGSELVYRFMMAVRRRVK